MGGCTYPSCYKQQAASSNLLQFLETTQPEARLRHSRRRRRRRVVVVGVGCFFGSGSGRCRVALPQCIFSLAIYYFKGLQL